MRVLLASQPASQTDEQTGGRTDHHRAWLEALLEDLNLQQVASSSAFAERESRPVIDH